MDIVVDSKYVFLSYSRKDIKFVKQLAVDLKKEGFSVWMDQSSIPGGKHWDNHIEQALKKSFAVVLVISKASVKSENVKDEISFSKQRGVKIIPVLYQEAETPLGWDRWQWIDFRGNYYQGVNSLVDALNDKSVPQKTSEWKKFFKIAVYVFFVGLFIALTVMYLPKMIETMRSPSNVLHSINANMQKDNVVIIGNGNSDINITQQ